MSFYLNIILLLCCCIVVTVFTEVFQKINCTMTHIMNLPALLSPIKDSKFKPNKTGKSLKKKVLKLCKRKLKGLHPNDIFSAKHVLIKNMREVIKKQNLLVDLFPGDSEDDMEDSPDLIEKQDLLQGSAFPKESEDGADGRNSPGSIESLLNEIDLDQSKLSGAHPIPIHVSTLDEQAVLNGGDPPDTQDKFHESFGQHNPVSGDKENSLLPIPVHMSTNIEDAELYNSIRPSDVLDEFHNCETFEDREFERILELGA